MKRSWADVVKGCKTSNTIQESSRTVPTPTLRTVPTPTPRTVPTPTPRTVPTPTPRTVPTPSNHSFNMVDSMWQFHQSNRLKIPLVYKHRLVNQKSADVPNALGQEK